MARVIDRRDPTTATLEQACEALRVWGFDPREEESVAHAANWLARLGNDRAFLGDRLVDLLAGRAPEGEAAVAIEGTQTHRILLAAPGHGSRGAGDVAISASIWPSADEPLLRASGGPAFGYGLAHDHPFDFLTLGYFGPGHGVDDFEYDYASVAGWPGEAVALRHAGRSWLAPGRLVHYRANRDVHRPFAPEALSVSLTLAHHHPANGWMDHYVFDVEGGTIARVLGQGPSEAFLRVAVGLGGEEAKDLAHRFGRHHPSDRMRLAAWRALASVAPDMAARDAVWAEAERSGSRVVASAARCRRREPG